MRLSVFVFSAESLALSFSLMAEVHKQFHMVSFIHRFTSHPLDMNSYQVQRDLTYVRQNACTIDKKADSMLCICTTYSMICHPIETVYFRTLNLQCSDKTPADTGNFGNLFGIVFCIVSF